MKLSPKLFALVFAGGALGSALRHGVGFFENQTWQLLAVNVLGAFVIGLANARQRPEWFQALISIGFAGGFTTMSGIALVMALSPLTSLATTILWVLATFALGLGSYWLGTRLGRQK